MKKLFYLMLLIIYYGISIAEAKYAAIELIIENGRLSENQYVRVKNHIYSQYGFYYDIIIYKDLQLGISPNHYYYDLDIGKYGNQAEIEIMQKGNIWRLWNDYSISPKIGFLLPEDQTICKKLRIQTQNLTQNETLNVIQENSDIITLYIDYNIDHDLDGLGATQELAYSTNPENPDTDDDNLNDYWDVNGTNIEINLDDEPIQTINTAATDPLNPDTDGDGVLDGVEVYGLEPYDFITDPNNPDTDGDGVIDGQDPNPLGMTDENGDGIPDEWVAFWLNQINQWGFPSGWITSIANPDADTDGDSISNRDEYENGTVPIVPNGHYETRIIPSPLVISAVINEIVTAEFSVVDLSFQPSTGEVFQLSQSWADEIHAVPENLLLKYLSTNEWYQENMPARFCSRFGIYNKFQFVINTANLTDNTTYKDKILVVVGGITNECEVHLLIGNSPENNHVPTFGSLIFPSNKAAVKDVDNVQLQWSAATDEDTGDSITYEIRCSAFHFTGAPDTMVTDIIQTSVQAVGWEEGLTDRLEDQRKYEWQVVARDNYGAAAFSPIWSFTTMPSNYVDIVILSSELRKGYIGRSYKEQLRAAYGFPPYQWNIISGSLPAGLLLKNDGVVYGEPTVSGNYNFDVEAEDWVGGKTSTAINLEIGITGSGEAGSIGHGTAGHGSF